MRTIVALRAMAAICGALAIAGGVLGCSAEAPAGHDQAGASSDVGVSSKAVTISPDGDLARIRVVHWNIAGGVVAFTDEFPFLNENRPHNMGRSAPLEPLLNFIDEWRPDVVSVNEITAVQYADLIATLKLKGYTVTGHFVTTGFNIGPAGGAIIVLGEANDEATYYWNGERFERGGEQSSRAIACLTADLGRQVRVCSTHLETTDSIAATQVQSVIRDWAADLEATPHLIIGDLNAEPNWLGGLLYPPNVGNGCFGAGGPFVEADMNDANCGEATHGEGKIDYVLGTAAHFTDQGFAEVRDGGKCILTLAGHHPCSDHRAVLAEMELRLFDHGLGSATPSYAGPDVAGNAGAAINLYGRAPEGAQAVQWSYVAGPTTGPVGTCTFADPSAARTTITCDRPGTYVATLTVEGLEGGVVSDTALVRITNRAPELSITSLQPWQLFQARSSVGLEASISDTPGDSHTCVVNWDDGSTEEFAATGGSCVREHVYANAGMYTIRASVRDSAGASGRDEVLVIVHDPSGGWANLDFSLNSRPGALTNTTTSSDEIWATLTGRYYNGATTPVGEGRAWLTGTDFRVEVRSLDWVVVTPDGKVAARGTGSVAGQPGYGFVIYGYDGCATNPGPACQTGDDRARVLVWPLASSSYPRGTLTYDSSVGDNYDLDEVALDALRSGIVTPSYPDPSH